MGATQAATAASTTAGTVQANVGVLYAWWALGIVSFLLAALFSGAEIGIYSLSKVRLRLRTARGEERALLLREWLEKPTYAIEALLVLQNVTGFGVSAACTGILSYYGYPEWAQGAISIAVVAPIAAVVCGYCAEGFISYAHGFLDVSSGAVVEVVVLADHGGAVVADGEWVELVEHEGGGEPEGGGEGDGAAVGDCGVVSGIRGDGGIERDAAGFGAAGVAFGADQRAGGDDSVESGGGRAGVDFIGGVSGVGAAV